MVEKARSLVYESLSTGATPQRVLTAIRLVDQALQNGIDVNREGQAKECCAKGCSHCCHMVVHATIAEVVQAADYVGREFSAEQRSELDEKLYAYERAVAPFFGRNLGDVRTQCPLLNDGFCTIYEARPLRCRGVNSLDVSECERQKLHPELEIAPPRTAGQMELTRESIRGVLQGLSMCSPDAGILDFARALRIALQRPDAFEKHLARQNPFNPARALPSVTEQPRVEGAKAFYPAYKPGEEPAGSCVAADLIHHFELYVKGDTAGAIRELTGHHPINLLRKVILPHVYRSEDEISFWREHLIKVIGELEEAEFDPREAYDGLQALNTFEIAYQQYNDRDVLSRLGRVVCERITGRALPDLCQPIERRRAHGKIKVGYISENLTFSNGGSWALGWLKNHGEDVETTAICLSDSPDLRTQQFRMAADHFLHFTKGNPANARQIKELGLDVLIYTDIGMSGRNYQYASMRLAPIQCTAWGHPVTSGLPTIDYYLSSELMEPSNGQDHYTEKLVRLPGSGLCYERDPNPAAELVKSDFGLDDGPLYLSCQNPMKYLPRWDFIYRDIQIKTGRPIVFVEGSAAVNTAPWKERFADAGIEAVWLPALGMSDFLGLINLADVCLDTPGWNGGNTTIQALSAGIPLATLPGEFMRGRHSLAFCQIAGAPGFVARDATDYVDLAASPDRLRSAMASLNSQALFDDKRPVVALDEFFRSHF